MKLKNPLRTILELAYAELDRCEDPEVERELRRGAAELELLAVTAGAIKEQHPAVWVECLRGGAA